jgi:hypothetical protein
MTRLYCGRRVGKGVAFVACSGCCSCRRMCYLPLGPSTVTNLDLMETLTTSRTSLASVRLPSSLNCRQEKRSAAMRRLCAISVRLFVHGYSTPIYLPPSHLLIQAQRIAAVRISPDLSLRLSFFCRFEYYSPPSGTSRVSWE